MERLVKKIENGRFALRSYEVEKCIKKRDVMHCKHGDAVMTMDPESLKSKQLGRSPLIQSTTGSSDFYLIDYKWEPNIVNND